MSIIFKDKSQRLADRIFFYALHMTLKYNYKKRLGKMTHSPAGENDRIFAAGGPLHEKLSGKAALQIRGAGQHHLTGGKPRQEIIQGKKLYKARNYTRQEIIQGKKLYKTRNYTRQAWMGV